MFAFGRPDVVVDMNAQLFAFDAQVSSPKDRERGVASSTFGSIRQVSVHLFPLVVRNQDKIEETVPRVCIRREAQIGSDGTSVHRFDHDIFA
jgi:hypothetical protein